MCTKQHHSPAHCTIPPRTSTWNVQLLIPALLPFLQKTNYSWTDYTEPSKTGSLSLKNGTFWPRGKLLGGSSAINAMLYVRGNKNDYDKWHAAGNPTWSWEEVLPYFKKSENNKIAKISADKRYHGTEGTLSVDYYGGKTSPILNVMKNGYDEIGLKEVLEVNGDKYIGFVRSQGTLLNGARCSTAKAFLSPHIIGDRSNLHIIKHAHVTKLDICPKTKLVQGVRFNIGEDKIERIVKSTKETILSAGTINSPQILMLSGIGPKQHLIDMGITPIVDQPFVGKNLQDHLIVPYIFEFHESSAQPLPPIQNLKDFFQYDISKSGNFAGIAGTDHMTFMSTTDNPIYPDIQFHHYIIPKQTNLMHLLNLFNYNDTIVKSIVDANKRTELVMIFITLLNPISRGSIELRSSNPFDNVRIKANYFKEIDDLYTMIKAIRKLQKLLETKTFKKHEGKFVKIGIADCDKLEFDSDNYWICYSRHLTATIYHPVGSVKMGPVSDEQAVVDPELILRGVQGLRVVDASVMPTIISGNTNAPTIMIGEKAADFIKNKWKNHRSARSINEIRGIGDEF